MQQPTFCPNCGKVVPPGSKFCPECGQALPATTNSAPPTPPYGLPIAPQGGETPRAAAQTQQPNSSEAGRFSSPPLPPTAPPFYSQTGTPAQPYAQAAPPLGTYQPPTSYPSQPPSYAANSVLSSVAQNSRQLNPWLIGGGVALLVIGVFSIAILLFVLAVGSNQPDQSTKDIQAGQLGLGCCAFIVVLVMLVPGALMIFFGRRKR